MRRTNKRSQEECGLTLALLLGADSRVRGGTRRLDVLPVVVARGRGQQNHVVSVVVVVGHVCQQGSRVRNQKNRGPGYSGEV